MGELDRPFHGRDAVALGLLTTHDLRKDFVAVFRGVYVRKGTAITLRVRTEAAVVWSGQPVVVMGLAAAALHGSKWVDDTVPIALNRPGHRVPSGVVGSNDQLCDTEVCRRAGMLVASAARVAFDLGRKLPPDSALEALDALFRATKLVVADVEAIADRHPGLRVTWATASGRSASNTTVNSTGAIAGNEPGTSIDWPSWKRTAG